MLQLNTNPLADFDRPIDMMQDCHRRVERFLAALAQAGDEAPPELTDEWRQLLRTALDYFDGAAPLHTRDEEESLFPRLRAHADEQGVADALAVIKRLEHEHDTAQPLHDEQERLGRAWLAAGGLSAADRARFVALSMQLQVLYAQHIRLEDEHVFVVARRVIGVDDQRVIGEEMRARRGGSSCSERKAAVRSEERASGNA